MVQWHHRKGMEARYRKQGFEAKRDYLDMNGNSYEATPCFYCGLLATTTDHAYPLVALASMDKLGMPAPSEMLVKVPCCAECNRLLADSIHNEMSKRFKCIKKRIRKKYKKHLKGEQWDKEELSELGHSLRSYVEQWESNRIVVLDRLDWLPT